MLSLSRSIALATPSFDPLYAAAYRLLGLQGYRSGVARPNYIGNLISWRRATSRPCAIASNTSGADPG